MSSTAICLIRKFKNDDLEPIQNMIHQTVMEKVHTYFMNAIFSELLIQISAVMVGIGFIILSIPFKFCILCIPIAIVLLYTSIWAGHFMKAHELITDALNISSNYMNDVSTCFYVAELHGKAGEAEMAHLMNKPKKVEYIFCNEKEFQFKDYNLAGFGRTIVGCIAVTKSMKAADSAWIRRMIVKQEYRRRTVATHLLMNAISFCEQQKYNGIDLITTACQSEARELYLREGFNIVDTSVKNHIGFGPNEDRYTMYLSLKRRNEGEDASSASF